MSLQKYIYQQTHVQYHQPSISHHHTCFHLRSSTAPSSAWISQIMDSEHHTLIDGEVHRWKWNNMCLWKQEEDRQLITEGGGKISLNSQQQDINFSPLGPRKAKTMALKNASEFLGSGLVFASSVLWTTKIHRTELNWTVVWSIFRLWLPKFGVIPVAGCLISKIIQNRSKTSWNQLQPVKQSRALHSLVTSFITFNLIFGSSKTVKNWERYN